LNRERRHTHTQAHTHTHTHTHTEETKQQRGERRGRQRGEATRDRGAIRRPRATRSAAVARLAEEGKEKKESKFHSSQQASTQTTLLSFSRAAGNSRTPEPTGTRPHQIPFYTGVQETEGERQNRAGEKRVDTRRSHSESPLQEETRRVFPTLRDRSAKRCTARDAVGGIATGRALAANGGEERRRCTMGAVIRLVIPSIPPTRSLSLFSPLSLPHSLPLSSPLHAPQ